MSTNRVAYFRDETKQARYRHLLEKNAAISASTPTLLNENPLPILCPAEFHTEMKAMVADGASYNEHLHINRHVDDVLVTFPSRIRRTSSRHLKACSMRSPLRRWKN